LVPETGPAGIAVIHFGDGIVVCACASVAKLRPIRSAQLVVNFRVATCVSLSQKNRIP